MTKKVKIDIVARDKTKQAIGSTKKGLEGLKKSVFNLRNAFIGLGAGLVVRSLVNTGKEVENLQVRFKFLFGSVQQGNVAFANLTKFASKVPFSLQEIARGSGSLAVVAKSAEDLTRILKITGNAAAISGLDFATASEQIQRAFSGGIGAADLFREKGITALLGFKAGAKVTVEETIAAFEKAFGAGGKFDGATDDLAKTFSGTVSMLGDKLFNFKRQINQQFFTSLKKAIGDLDSFFERNAESTELLAKKIGAGLSVAVRTLADLFKTLKDNANELATVFGLIISYKIAKVFMGAVTSLNALTVAMTSFNIATKKNIIFGGIAIFVAAMVTLNAKFRELKGEVEDAFEVRPYEEVRKELLRLTKFTKEYNHEAEKGSREVGAGYGIALTKLEAVTLEYELLLEILEQEGKLYLENTAHMRTMGTVAVETVSKMSLSMSLFDEQLNQQKLSLASVDEEYIKMIQHLGLLNQAQIEVGNGFDAQKQASRDAHATEVQTAKQAADKNLEAFRTGEFGKIDVKKVTNKQMMQMGRDTLQQGAMMNKEMFRLNQALNIGEAVMNTAKGVSAALGIANIPLALLIGAMGAVQVATIAAQQPPAMFGGVRQQGTPFLVGERGPELFTPSNAGTVTPNHQLGGGGATVNFNITTVDARSFGNLLDTRRGQIVNMINSALNNKGQAALV